MIVVAMLFALLIGAIIIPMYYTTIYLLRYRDLHYLRIFVISLYISLWNVSRLVLTLAPAWDFFSDIIIIVILRLGNLFLLMGLLTLAYLLNNISFGEIPRSLAMIGISFFSAAAALLVLDFYDPQAMIYVIQKNSIEIIYGELFSVFVTIGAFGLFFASITAIRSLDSLPKAVYQSRPMYYKTISFAAVVLFLIWVFHTFLSLLSSYDFNTIVTITLNVFYLLILVYLRKQPFFQFNMGLSARNIVVNHYVGYLVGAITDLGPTVITYSKEFTKKVGLEQLNLENLNLGAITSLGINDTFDEKVAILPLSEMNEFSAIVFSFESKYEGIEDNRIRDSTMVIFAIIIPSALLVNINNINQAREKIQQLFRNYEELNDMMDKKILQEVTITCLNFLTI